jgi:hypothetical protein
MGDAAKISPRVSSTCLQIAILSVLIIYIIPSRQIYVAIRNPPHAPSITCLTPGRSHWNYVHVANNISQADNLPSNGC